MTDVTLYLGDCLDFMRTLPAGSVDAVVTDPPYPGLAGGLKYRSTGGVAPARQDVVTVGTPWGDDILALTEIKRVARYGAIVFCSWHSIAEVKELCGGSPVGLVTWYKRNTQPSFRNRPHYSCEYAWLIEFAPGMNWQQIETMYDIPNLPAGCFASERIIDGTGKAAHPTQKPLELMTKLVSAAGATILDPFMGSGTTGVACVQTGRNFIGCEIDAGYFEIAQQRIALAQQSPMLPGMNGTTPQAEQLTFDTKATP